MRNRVLEATTQDPCGRLPAPDSYAGSAAPSIAGVGGHPTRFSRSQDVAGDRDDSYGVSRVWSGISSFIFLEFWIGMVTGPKVAGWRTRQGGAAPGGGQALIRSRGQQGWKGVPGWPADR
jgi:hypothetical protein